MSFESRLRALEEPNTGLFKPSNGLSGRWGEDPAAGDVRFAWLLALSAAPRRFQGEPEDVDLYHSLGIETGMSDTQCLKRCIEIARREGFSEGEIAFLKKCYMSQSRVAREDVTFDRTGASW